MLSYARRRVFTTLQMDSLRLAIHLVDAVSDEWGDELRCHELARAVWYGLQIARPEWVLVDGKVGPVEHSWLVWDSRKSVAGTLVWLKKHGEVQRHAGAHGSILDVYVPGQEPQVQLIDAFTGGMMYRISKSLRTDIMIQVIDKLRHQMGLPFGDSRPF